MSLPTILTLPNPILRQKLDPVHEFNGLAELAETMLAVMRKAQGVGLAANQIGRTERMFVYALDEPLELEGSETIPAIAPQTVVNPIITILDTATETDEEGCLSLPHIYGPVARPKRILLEAQDASGRHFKRELNGYEARVVQHETDHLNGILFLDHVKDPSKLRRV